MYIYTCTYAHIYYVHTYIDFANMCVCMYFVYICTWIYILCIDIDTYIKIYFK